MTSTNAPVTENAWVTDDGNTIICPCCDSKISIPPGYVIVPASDVVTPEARAAIGRVVMVSTALAHYLVKVNPDDISNEEFRADLALLESIANGGQS